MNKIDIPKEPAVRREWIKYQLRLKGYSLRQLSAEHGVYWTTAQQVLRVPMPKWEKIISDKIGLLPQDLWPERYDQDGKPNRHSPRYPRNDTTSTNRLQCLTVEEVLP